MENIRTVIWDCDGVMWFYKKPRVEAQLVAKALNIPYSKRMENEYFDMLDSFISRFANKKITLKKYYQLIEEKMPILGFFNISGEQFTERKSSIQTELSIPNKDSVLLLEYLKNKGIKNVVKSDFWREEQIAKMRQYEMLDYIEAVYGCDSGYLKSHHLATVKDIIKPGQEKNCIIIGDSLKCDIAFAEREGIGSIWFNRDGKHINETQYSPTFEVSSLLEIMKIL